MIATLPNDLWGLVNYHHHVDPQRLTEAIEDQVARRDLDYRSRLLIRDSVKALRDYWGDERVTTWLANGAFGPQIEAICQGPFDDNRGFPSLMRRVMDVTRPETVEQMFRELSQHAHRPIKMYVGGSIALIMPGLLARKTEDVDVVDEVPAEFRSQHQLLAELAQRFRLELTHFQRHYLPVGWEQRLHSLPSYGRLQVFLVDPYDVYLSKLFSIRDKDKNDLVSVLPLLDKEVLVRRLKDTTGPMLANEELRKRAENNWYILFGDPLPT